ncbi:MAG: XRE family transcriptional regulator [Hyphomicrobiales bacterium]|jgi:transcriptional regulator with XRE-family HTH domain|nr:MAG: XRE family transcriptional regulator [Hyphomicrobiales bacterium]
MLSEALRLIRVFHDLKQNELADRLGVSKSYISEVESGKKQPTIEIINKYASEFSIPASSILFFSEQLESGEGTKAANARKYIADKVLKMLNFIDEKSKTQKDD